MLIETISEVASHVNLLVAFMNANKDKAKPGIACMCSNASAYPVRPIR
jgi:hypothetical protein